MTDIPPPGAFIPGRLGVSGVLVDGDLVLDVVPQPGTLHHGVIRASVLSYAIDAVAGIVLDTDPDAWTLTTDMTVRMAPVPAPDRVRAVNTVLRNGRRSATASVEVTTLTGVPVASAAIGFARVPRRAGDPPKHSLSPEEAVAVITDVPRLSQPLREEAGIEVLDAAAGVVEVAVTPELRNPAGTLQGAMVALVAEAAAEGVVAARTGAAVVVTELDLRYLAPAPVGPVRTRCRPLGDAPDAPVRVELTDTSTGTLTTLVFARAVVVG